MEAPVPTIAGQGPSMARRLTSLWVERWYWLLVFCVISWGIQYTLANRSRVFGPTVLTARPTEMEVELQPLQEEPQPQAQPLAAKETPHTPKEPQQESPVVRELMRQVRGSVQPALPIVAPAMGPQGEREIVDAPPAAKAAAAGGFDHLKNESPMATGSPTGVKDAGAPQIERFAKVDEMPGGGGSVAPGPVLGGKGGAPLPEAPPEDILFNGGGAGGINLPKAAPRIGGGGGRSILSVENPLAKEAIPEEKPGLGPGLGGGQGTGSGGGVGFSRDRGIGTTPDGQQPLATLHSKPGSGIGAGVGTGIGTQAPGGGTGTGAELPGTGGEGTGYGRGKGTGIGSGEGDGVGTGRGVRIGRHPGVPLGDVGGQLHGSGEGGGTGGGPGGAGRGGVFGVHPGGGGGSKRVVYVLDVSGSMGDENKIGKAKEELKQALSELTSRDMFNIVTFYAGYRTFSDEMVKATRGNVEAAYLFIDFAQLKDGTNYWDMLKFVLGLDNVKDSITLSDGEPTVKEKNPEKIRDMVKERNSGHIRISTIAVSLGERFPGMALLRGLADDNDGHYRYINLHGR